MTATARTPLPGKRVRLRTYLTSLCVNLQASVSSKHMYALLGCWPQPH